MKCTKRLLAIILSFVIAFSVCIPVHAVSHSAQSAVQSVSSARTQEEYEDALEAFTGVNRSSTRQLNFALRLLRLFYRVITGQLLLPDRNLDVNLDARLLSYTDYILENSDFDVEKILTSLPETMQLAQLTTKVLRIDTEKMRKDLYEKRDQYNKQGDDFKGNIYHFLGAYFSVITTCEISTVPTSDPDVYEVLVTVVYKDGGTEEMHPHIFINDKTGEAYGKKDKGMLGLGFNCSIYDLVVYAPVNAWMRNYGFCLFYDEVCYASPSWMWGYTTRRFKFDYDGKEWMIQAWKGHYAITNGGEIGIYNRPKEKFGSFYNCVDDDDMLEMGMTISHGEEELLSLPQKMHWWINGFKMGKVLYPPKSLTMEATIVMKDEAMLEAFCRSIDRNYRRDVTYTTDGLTVCLHW